jgi:hypothetical protein
VQPTQAVEPATLNVLAAHAAHAETEVRSSKLLKVPAAHLVHALAPMPLNVPTGQMEHEPEPAAL